MPNEQRSIQISEVTDDAGFYALKSDWQALISQSSSVTFFQTWEWLSTWWRHLGEGDLWILVAREQGTVIGIMPLVISTGNRTGLRRVNWLARFSDCHDLIALPSESETCADAFLNYIAKCTEKWDLCDLGGLPESAALVQTKATRSLIPLVRSDYSCPVLSLPSSLEAYLGSYSSKMRYNILRQQKQLEKAFTVEIAMVQDNCAEYMQNLFKLHNEQWQSVGMPGMFKDSKVQNFHLDMAQQFLERGWLRLHYLRLNGELCAAIYGFQMGPTYSYYLSGMDKRFSKYGLGSVMILHSISDAIKNGCSIYSFLKGEEPYKYFWKAQNEQLVRLVIMRYSARSLTAAVIEEYLTYRATKAKRQAEKQLATEREF